MDISEMNHQMDFVVEEKSRERFTKQREFSIRKKGINAQCKWIKNHKNKNKYKKNHAMLFTLMHTSVITVVKKSSQSEHFCNIHL